MQTGTVSATRLKGPEFLGSSETWKQEFKMSSSQSPKNNRNSQDFSLSVQGSLSLTSVAQCSVSQWCGICFELNPVAVECCVSSALGHQLTYSSRKTTLKTIKADLSAVRTSHITTWIPASHCHSSSLKWIPMVSLVSTEAFWGRCTDCVPTPPPSTCYDRKGLQER